MFTAKFFSETSRCHPFSGNDIVYLPTLEGTWETFYRLEGNCSWIREALPDLPPGAELRGAYVIDLLRMKFEYHLGRYGNEPDWTHHLSLEQRKIFRRSYAIAEAELFFCVPDVPRAGLGYFVTDDGITADITRAFGLERLRDIRQLGRLHDPVVTDASLPVGYGMLFGHNRLSHSLDVRAIALLMATNNHLAPEAIRILEVAGLTHDTLTPAYGDGTKAIDPKYFDGHLSVPKAILNDDITDETAYTSFTEAWIKPILPHLERKNSFYIFNADPMIFALREGMRKSGLTFSQLLIWVKTHAVIGRKDYAPQHELIAYGWYGVHKFQKPNDKSVIVHPKPAKNPLHPTQKPVGLIRRLVLNGTRMGDIVFDGFAGSGTLGLAAHQTGRKAILIERDEAYVQTILIDASQFDFIIGWERGLQMPKSGSGLIYEKISKQHKVPKEFVVMTGDSLFDDILPAVSVGLRAIHISNEKAMNAKDYLTLKNIRPLTNLKKL